MTDAQFQTLMEAILQQSQILERILNTLEQPKTAPNYQVALAEFNTFDWSSISATVEQRDQDGVAAVLWKGNRYIRRSASNKFKPAIWFSRSIGKDDKGETQYERLITFMPITPSEPLPTKVKQYQHP